MIIHVEYLVKSTESGWVEVSCYLDLNSDLDTTYWYTSIDGIDVSKKKTEAVTVLFSRLG